MSVNTDNRAQLSQITDVRQTDAASPEEVETATSVSPSLQDIQDRMQNVMTNLQPTVDSLRDTKDAAQVADIVSQLAGQAMAMDGLAANAKSALGYKLLSAIDNMEKVLSHDCAVASAEIKDREETLHLVVSPAES